MKNQRFNQIKKITLIGAILNILLSFIKIAIGIIGRSQAIVSDGLHSLSDLISDFFVLVGSSLSSKPSDSTHHYGHGKFETLSTLLIGVILSTVAIKIGISSYETVVAIISGVTIEPPKMIVLLAAIVSVIAKELLFRYTLKNGKEIQSDAVIANAYHHRSDSYSSIGTTIGVFLAIILGDNWVILDPIAGIIISGIIIYEALQILKKSLDELLEASLPHETNNIILDTVTKIPGIYNTKNLKTRKIGNLYAIELSIEVSANISVDEGHILSHIAEEQVRNKLDRDINISIHIEPVKI